MSADTITETGPGGRITRRDVQRAIEAGTTGIGDEQATPAPRPHALETSDLLADAA